MTKKLFTILLAVIMLLTVTPVAAFAEDDMLSYLTYSISNGEVTITGCDGAISGDFVIPDTIEGYPVTKIGEGAFAGCRYLTQVALPSSLTEIGQDAFIECYDLQSIEIPDSVKTIGGGAFSYCSGLSDIRLPEGITEILDLFWYCTGLTDIQIPESVTSIGGYTFLECSGLTDLTIPKNVTNIGQETFSACKNLKSITFLTEDTLTIGDSAFLGCNSLETVSINPTVELSLGKNAFSDCIAIDNLDFLPDGYHELTNRVFPSCLGFESLTIPERITAIDNEVFDECLFLKEVTNPDSLQKIGEGAFINCPLLESVTFYNRDIVLQDKSFGYSTIEITGDKEVFETLWKAFFDSPEEEQQTIREEILAMCVIHDELQPDSDFTIYGYKGSTAETYANENGFIFIPICEHHYVAQVTTPATYTHPGTGSMVCEFCGDVSETYEIPMLTIEESEEKADSATDVSVIYPEGTFDGEAEIQVTPVSEGEAYQLISHKEGNYKVTMFDISVTVDGEKVQPNGTVLVSIPLPNGYNQNKCVVYYVADDGTMEELTTYHFKDGYVSFETNHFSYYAVVEEDSEPSDSHSVMDDIRSFFQSLVDFFNRILSWFKSLFGKA